MSQPNLIDVKFTGKGDDAALAKAFIDHFGASGVACSNELFKAFELLGSDKPVTKELKAAIAEEVVSLRELAMLTSENPSDVFPGSLEVALL